MEKREFLEKYIADIWGRRSAAYVGGRHGI